MSKGKNCSQGCTLNISAPSLSEGLRCVCWTKEDIESSFPFPFPFFINPIAGVNVGYVSASSSFKKQNNFSSKCNQAPLCWWTRCIQHTFARRVKVTNNLFHPDTSAFPHRASTARFCSETDRGWTVLHRTAVRVLAQHQLLPSMIFCVVSPPPLLFVNFLSFSGRGVSGVTQQSLLRHITVGLEGQEKKTI